MLSESSTIFRLTFRKSPDQTSTVHIGQNSTIYNSNAVREPKRASMSSKKVVELLKQIVQYVQVGNGFEKVLKNVCCFFHWAHVSDGI